MLCIKTTAEKHITTSFHKRTAYEHGNNILYMCDCGLKMYPTPHKRHTTYNTGIYMDSHHENSK
jgi:hypothetical protein